MNFGKKRADIEALNSDSQQANKFLLEMQNWAAESSGECQGLSLTVGLTAQLPKLLFDQSNYLKGLQKTEPWTNVEIQPRKENVGTKLVNDYQHSWK